MRLWSDARPSSSRYMHVLIAFFLVCSGLVNHAVFGQNGQPHPRGLEDHIAMGSEALVQGENARAEAEFRRALSLDPDAVPLLNNLGLALARQNRNDEAITVYRRALTLKPHDSVTERNLGVAYFRARKFADAQPILEHIAISTPSFQSLELAGLNLFAMDRYPQAETYLERARALEPNDLDNLNLLGQAYLRSKNYAAVTEVFTHMMAVRPNSAEAHVMLATAYDKLFREQDAIQEFQEAAHVDPNYPGVHTDLGLIYFRLDEPDLAKHEFLLGLQQSRTDPIANCSMGRILRREGRVQEAIEYFLVALSVNGKYLDALREIGQSLVALKEPGKAIDFLRRAETLDPADAENHFILGTALRNTGHLSEGNRERAKAAEILSEKHAVTSPGLGDR